MDVNTRAAPTGDSLPPTPEIDPALVRPPLLRRLTGVMFGATGTLVLTTGGTLVVRMLSSITLTRILVPDVFGLTGIISSIFFIVVMMTDLGFQSYVVRHERGDDARFKDVIWTIHVGRGAAIALACAGAAPLLAWALAKPQLTWPLMVASTSMLINGLSSLSLISALRSGMVRRLSLLDFWLTVFQTAVTVGLALWLRSVWAIIFAMVLHAFARTLASYTLFPDPRRRMARDVDLSREFFAFSRVVIASSVVQLLLLQSDKMVLARAFTLAEFGFYAIALNLASALTSFAETYVARVLFPIYARTWNNERERLAEVYYAARRWPARLFALAGGGMVGAAPLIITILYDPRYRSAGLFLSLLAISATLRLPNFAVAELATATGDIKVTLRANLVKLGWLCVAGPIAFLSFGAVGLVAVVGLMELPTMLYGWSVLRQAHVLNLREELSYLGILGLGLIIGAAMSAGALRFLPIR